MDSVDVPVDVTLGLTYPHQSNQSKFHFHFQPLHLPSQIPINTDQYQSLKKNPKSNPFLYVVRETHSFVHVRTAFTIFTSASPSTSTLHLHLQPSVSSCINANVSGTKVFNIDIISTLDNPVIGSMIIHRPGC